MKLSFLKQKQYLNWRLLDFTHAHNPIYWQHMTILKKYIAKHLTDSENNRENIFSRPIISFNNINKIILLGRKEIREIAFKWKTTTTKLIYIFYFLSKTPTSLLSSWQYILTTAQLYKEKAKRYFTVAARENDKPQLSWLSFQS